VALLAAMLLTMAPGRARAQYTQAGDAPSRGLLIPGASSTLDRHAAAAVEINPAQGGWLRSWELAVGHTELAPDSRFVGTGTGLFFSYRLPLIHLNVTAGAQLLRPARGFGELYPDAGKLSLALAYTPAPWLSVGLAGHVFVAPHAPGGINGLTTLDAGLTLHPASWLALSVVGRDLTNPSWAGLPLQRGWDLELGVRPLSSGRLGIGLGVQIGERRGDVTPRLVLQGEPWPGLTLFADAAWLRRDLDDDDGQYRRSHDVRVTAGVRVGFSRVGLMAAFVGGYHVRPGGAAAGGSAWLRLSGARHRSVSHRSGRILLVDVERLADTRALWRLLSVLHRAAHQPGVKAVLIKLGVSPGWARAEELRGAIARLRRAGTSVYVYLYSATGAGYYAAAAADRILLFPGGGLRFAGLSSTRFYVKALLDKLGVKAQIVKHGEYKTAPEPFTRTGPSQEARKVRDQLLDEFAGRVYRALAARPKIKSAVRAKAVLAKGPFTAGEAKSLGLVDRLVWPDEAPKTVQKLLGRRLPLERPPSGPRHRARWAQRPYVAVVAVEGDIVEGRSRTIPLIDRRTAGAQSLVKLLGRLAEDPRARAVVLRVESGGGSALGSEVICRTVAKLAEIKPVVASLGDVAASGGYFVAVPAKQIFADPSTITGSIGIFAGKADISGLLNRLGVSADLERRGTRADVDSWFRPYTEAEKKALKRKLRYYYHRFLDAVVRGRKRAGLSTRQQVEKVARGRIWSGHQARQRKLVDRLGGLYDAVRAARKLAGLAAGDGHTVRVLPRRRPGLLARAARLLLPDPEAGGGGGVRPGASPGPGRGSGLRRLFRRLLRPLSAIPPSLYLSVPSTPLARMPYVIDIR
jgi:protease-4